MDTKYIAIVYECDMNDILKGANIIGTFQGMKDDDKGRYTEMSFYEIGFDYKTWKALKEAKVIIEYIDDMGNLYSLNRGRCTNLNRVVKVKDVVNIELENAKVIKEQLALRDKYLASGDSGIVEYKAKATSAVPSKKAMSLIAYDKNIDLVMPFREIVNGGSGSPLFIYLHDKRSRSTNNTKVLLKECKNLISVLKGSGQQYTLVVPNVATSYGKMIDIEGFDVMVENGLNKLLKMVIDYEVKEKGVDPSRIYIMGMGSGVQDAVYELTLHGDTYAGAVLAFGWGDYINIDKFQDVAFEIVSASEDEEYDDGDISNLAGDIKSTGAKVNLDEMDGTTDACLKVFYKNTEWLTNIFGASRKVTKSAPAVPATEPAESSEATTSEDSAPIE